MAFVNPYALIFGAVGLLLVALGSVVAWYELRGIARFAPIWYRNGIPLLRGRVRYDRRLDESNAEGGVFVSKSGSFKKIAGDSVLARSRSESVWANMMYLKATVELENGFGEVRGRLPVSVAIVGAGLVLAAVAVALLDAIGGGYSNSSFGAVRIVALFTVVTSCGYGFVVSDLTRSLVKELRRVREDGEDSGAFSTGDVLLRDPDLFD